MGVYCLVRASAAGDLDPVAPLYVILYITLLEYGHPLYIFHYERYPILQCSLTIIY